MRFVLVFAFLLFSFMPAFAEGTQETPAMLQQDLSRACPHGYAVVNGKCTPPCAAGMTRTFSGKCQPVACPMGEELVGNKCAPKCPKKQMRDNSGVCVTAAAKQAAPAKEEEAPVPSAEPQPATDCPEGKEFANGECRSLCLANQERDTDGICVARCPKDAARVNGKCPGGQGLELR